MEMKALLIIAIVVILIEIIANIIAIVRTIKKLNTPK